MRVYSPSPGIVEQDSGSTGPTARGARCAVALAGSVALGLGSCAPPPPGVMTAPAAPLESTGATAGPPIAVSSPPPAPPVAPAPTTVVAVLEPGELAVLESRGFDFGHLSAGVDARTAHDLSSVPALRGIFST